MSLIHEAFAWWLAQLRDLAREMVPARLRTTDADAADALLVELGRNSDSDAAPGAIPDAGIVLRQRGREALLGRLDLDAGFPVALRALLGNRRMPAATLLRLPSGVLLERDVTLPLAAARDLDRVLGYEMNRLTPFTAAEVYWASRVVRQEPAQGRLHLRLSLVPRAGLDDAIALLRAAGRDPGGLRAPTAGGEVRRIGLDSMGARGAAGGGRRARLAFTAAAAACVLLGLVAAGLPLLQQARALATIEARTAALRPRAAEAAALRQRLASRTTAAELLTAEAARLGSALQAIATLTALLPDDTHLTALTLRQRRITLTGQSADAAKLIPLLSAEPALRDVAFLSPVTRAERDRAELFSIRLEHGS